MHLFLGASIAFLAICKNAFLNPFNKKNNSWSLKKQSQKYMQKHICKNINPHFYQSVIQLLLCLVTAKLVTE